MFQQFATNEINSLKNKEGTSQKGNKNGGGWDEYEGEIKIRFDSIYEDPMVELKNLKQTITVQVYQDLFEALMNKVKLTESYDISLFIGGLKDEIGTYVEEDGDLLLSEEGVVNTFHSLVDEQPLISLNALSGMNTYRTMRVKGCMERNALYVLVNSGITYNFLDLQIAKNLGCMLRRIYPMDVSVANRNEVVIWFWEFSG
ncbi:hypothetical protein Tco_1038600 [Tanacetum coccineum]